MAKRKGLGKGLDALFEDNRTELTAESSGTLIPIEEISPNKDQPRKDFDPQALQQLADSIREHGVLQPLLLRPMAAGGYQIVAGERRYRASRMVGLTQLPAVVREMDDRQAMAVALIENLQREDLNPIEEALGYRDLMEQFDMTQEQVANSVGKSRPVIANALRLLQLAPAVKDMVQKQTLSAGHARAILAFPAQQQETIAAEAMQKGYTVRQLERMAMPQKSAKPKAPKVSDSYYREMELALQQQLGNPVKITVDKTKGTLSIAFYTKEELQALAQRLTGQE